MFATLTFALQIFALQKTAPYGITKPPMAKNSYHRGLCYADIKAVFCIGDYNSLTK